MKFFLALAFFCFVFSGIATDDATEYTGVIRSAEVANALKNVRYELYIFVNDVQVYPRKSRKGLRNFQIGEKFRFSYRSGDEIRVLFCRKTILGRTFLLHVASASQNALGELFGKVMKTKEAAVELALDVPEGKYRITLKRSYFAPEDAVVCGGTVKNEDFKRRMANFLILFHEASPDERSRLLKEQTFKEFADYAVQSIEKLDHRIVVRQNGKCIFDSWAQGYRKTGRNAEWENVSFEIDWRLGDWIDVHFLDADLLDDDIVFERLTNTPFSIQMLKGCIRGGLLSNSCVVFSAECLE